MKHSMKIMIPFLMIAGLLTGCGSQATVTQITYDSKDFVRDESDITKTAYVYLPYGYALRITLSTLKNTEIPHFFKC